MKNILKTLAVTAALVGMSGGVAFADNNCDIDDTGPKSDNSVVCEETNNVSVSCVNGVYVVNDNDQEAGSGDAEGDGNTTGGGATSSDAVNENGTVVQIGTSCGEAATTTPTTPGGAGSGTPQVLAEATAQVKKPVGGVGAGAGAGATSNHVAATTGVLASASLVAAGLALRKHALGRN